MTGFVMRILAPSVTEPESFRGPKRARLPLRWGGRPYYDRHPLSRVLLICPRGPEA
jgi:hypothetical protein